MLESVVDLIACWKGNFGEHTSTETWSSITLCLMWTIWRELNICTFKGQELLSVQLKLLFFKSLYEWMSMSTFFIWNLVDFLADMKNFR